MRSVAQTAKRIVIKVGTSSLVYPNGAINLQAIDSLAFVISDLVNQGKEIVLVSSGAIGVGIHTLNLANRPNDIPSQQAVAAIGQSELMNIYTQRFQTYKQRIGQVLLTRDVIDYPESRQNVTNTLERLLAMGIVPIVNENDAVSVDELDHQTKFGDNDQLSAIVAQLTQADLLIMLSDIDGFFTANPAKHPDAQLYTHISEITHELYQQATGAGSKLGTGGMTSKLKAADRLLKVDQKMILANGRDPKIIFTIIAGDEVGTLFAK